MALYSPPLFVSDDFEQARLLIEAHPFATLITSVDGASPRISHVPLLLEDRALLGHVAAANPHWRAFAEGHTVAVFHGPHAYVSPRGYERPEIHVPTWNYATVHAEGRPQLLDARASANVLERLTAHFEAGSGYASDPRRLQQLLGGIVAFRIPIERWTSKFKMNQNRSPADRAGVVRLLRAAGSADDAAVADWMERHEPD